MRGFTYDGIHSSTYSVHARTSRMLLPPVKRREIDISGRHGSYDFGDTVYSKRFMSIQLQYIGASIHDLRLMSRDISAWLSKKVEKRLVFDDEPDKYYMAKIYDASDLTNFVRLGTAAIVFECQPLAQYIATTQEDIELQGDIPLDFEYTLDFGENYTFEVTGNTSFDVDYIGNYELGLGAPNGSIFNINITGAFTTLTIAINDNYITYSEAVASGTVVIDNVSATIKKDGTDKLTVCSGDIGEFLILQPGTNTVTITGTGLNCTIAFDFAAQYI